MCCCGTMLKTVFFCPRVAIQTVGFVLLLLWYAIRKSVCYWILPTCFLKCNSSREWIWLRAHSHQQALLNWRECLPCRESLQNSAPSLGFLLLWRGHLIDEQKRAWKVLRAGKRKINLTPPSFVVVRIENASTGTLWLLFATTRSENNNDTSWDILRNILKHLVAWRLVWMHEIFT